MYEDCVFLYGLNQIKIQNNLLMLRLKCTNDLIIITGRKRNYLIITKIRSHVN